MSEELEAILEAVRALSAEQRRELIAAMVAMDSSCCEALVRAVQGKYAHVATSSEAFMQRKAEDLDLESRA